MGGLESIIVWTVLPLAIGFGIPALLTALVTNRIRKKGRWRWTVRALILVVGMTALITLVASAYWVLSEMSEEPRTGHVVRNHSEVEVFLRTENYRGEPGSDYQYQLWQYGDDHTQLDRSNEELWTETCSIAPDATIIKVAPSYKFVPYADRGPKPYLQRNIPADQFEILGFIPHENCVREIWHEWDGKTINGIEDPTFGLFELALLTLFGGIATMVLSVMVDLRNRLPDPPPPPPPPPGPR